MENGRRGRTPQHDEAVLADRRRHIADLPSYDYRRAGALLNRERRAHGLPALNPKRIYRIMVRHQLLLPKALLRRQSSRVHDGRVSVATSDLRWCSDGFEIKCDSGQTVTATFAKDCCDREILALRARVGKGMPGEPVRDMLIEVVERRFEAVDPVRLERELTFLTDNGSAYIAHETRSIAGSLDLKLVNTPVRSPQSNSMAESFVNTFKRDYVSRMNLRDELTVLA